MDNEHRELTIDEANKIRKLCSEHEKFLTIKVFGPAFEMGFMHGAKHMKQILFNTDTSTEHREQEKIPKWLKACERCKGRISCWCLEGDIALSEDGLCEGYDKFVEDIKKEKEELTERSLSS